VCQFFKHCLSVPYIMEFSAQKLWYQGGQSLVLSKAEQWTQVKSKLMTIILTCGRYVLCLRHGGDQCGKRSEWAPSLRPSIHGNMNDKNYKQIKCTKIVPPIYTERIILWKESLNSDGRQNNQYLQKRTIISHVKSLNTRKTSIV
jgi:hypothetical protein